MIVTLYEDVVPAEKDLKHVTKKEIMEEDDKHKPLNQLEKDENGIYRKDNCIWISDEAVNIKLGIIVEAHCVERGHTAYNATLETIEATYWWSEKKQDIR